MTPEQLAEIRARAEAATPGPWELFRARHDIPALLDYVERLQGLLGEGAETIVWMSGSADFGADGVAGQGWTDKGRPALGRILAALTSKEPTNA